MPFGHVKYRGGSYCVVVFSAEATPQHFGVAKMSALVHHTEVYRNMGVSFVGIGVLDDPLRRLPPAMGKDDYAKMA